MLTEYWVNLAENFGSPRILQALFRLAKARARLKLKQIVDAEDASETTKFYNVILQQHQQVINIPKNPRDVTYNECINILKESKYALSFEEIARMVCTRNEQVKRYLDDKFKMQDSMKLRSVLTMLLNHRSIRQVQQKPVVLEWINSNGSDVSSIQNNDNHATYDNIRSNSIQTNSYDVYDAYDAKKKLRQSA
jgi:DNA replicative helicase MCM subunit Mcm2 (Cdc46/Mcm family)